MHDSMSQRYRFSTTIRDSFLAYLMTLRHVMVLILTFPKVSSKISEVSITSSDVSTDDDSIVVMGFLFGLKKFPWWDVSLSFPNSK